MILPPHEVELLNSITLDALTIRVRDLYVAGWSLQAIGDALIPPRRKTTIRSWVLKAAGASYSPQEVIDAPTPIPPLKAPKGRSKPSSDKSPSISPEDLEQIQQLSPLAQQFRSGMAPSSAPAIANARLSTLVKALYRDGISLKDLSLAANVTYRAMYKRVQPPRTHKTPPKNQPNSTDLTN